MTSSGYIPNPDPAIMVQRMGHMGESHQGHLLHLQGFGPTEPMCIGMG